MRYRWRFKINLFFNLFYSLAFYWRSIKAISDLKASTRHHKTKAADPPETATKLQLH